MPSDKEAERAYILNQAEEERYFREAALKQPTLYDVTRLIILQGCRPEEIMALEQKNIDLATRAMKITRGKSSAARRSLRLLPESVELLGRRLAKASTWVFPSPRYFGRHITKLNRQHDKVCEAIGLDIVIYDFRHTWATRMAQNGCPLPTLAKLMGHSNLRSVMRYIHIDEESGADAMERYGNKRVDGPSAFRPPTPGMTGTKQQIKGERKKA
jgi:integrase